MEVKVIWSKRAIKGLTKIFEYYSQEASLSVAQKLVKALVDSTIQLKQFPQSGSEEQLLKGNQKEYRYIIIGNYKILYYLKPNQIIISNVFDCRQNPTKIK